MPVISEHCFYCKYFKLSPEEETRRLQILADNGYPPAGMDGFCGASKQPDAHTWYKGNWVKLNDNKPKHNKFPVGHNAVPTQAQAPCHIYGEDGEQKFVPLAASIK